MHFAVTGANGYVGRHIVRALLDDGHEVTSVSRSSMPTFERHQHLTMDVLEPREDIFAQLQKPDICIHAAWENGFVHNHESHFRNVYNHIGFLRNMLNGGLRHFVALGTAHEVGFHVGAVTQETPCRPIHAYGVAKNYLREVQRLLCEEHKATSQWLRCYYITGDDSRNHSIFRRIAESAAADQATFPLNSGELLYDFINVEELARQIAKVASQCEVTGIINCCSGNPVTLRTKVLEFIAANNLSIEPVWGAFPLRPYDSKALWGDTTKLELALAAADRVG